MSGRESDTRNRIAPRPWPDIWQANAESLATIAPWAGQKNGFDGDHSAWIDSLADECEIEALSLLFDSSWVRGAGAMTALLETDSRELLRTARALRGARHTLDAVDAILSRMSVHIGRLVEARDRLRDLIAEYRRMGRREHPGRSP